MRPLRLMLTLCGAAALSSQTVAKDAPFIASQIAAQEAYANTCKINTSVFATLFGGTVRPQIVASNGCNLTTAQASYAKQIDQEYLGTKITDETYRKGPIDLFYRETNTVGPMSSLNSMLMNQSSIVEMDGRQNQTSLTLPGYKVINRDSGDQ